VEFVLLRERGIQRWKKNLNTFVDSKKKLFDRQKRDKKAEKNLQRFSVLKFLSIEQ